MDPTPNVNVGITPPPDASAQVQTTPSQVNTTVPRQPIQSAPAPPPVNPNLVHDTLFGKAAKFLMGNTTNYSIDPKTGQTITTQTPQTPGSLFRSILAGAILGGSAATEAHNQNPQMGGAAGATVGGAAGIKNNVQMDQLNRRNAQQQFENQQAAEREQREASESDTHQKLFKAQIAESNLQQLRLNQLIQGTSFDQHRAIAVAGQAQSKPYLDAGIAPAVDNLPESEFTQYLRDHPGSSSLDWEHTGVKTVIAPDGTPHFENTLTAFDPKGPVTISKATHDQWEKDGVFKRFPEYDNATQPGKTLTAQQFIAVKRNADMVRADALTRKKEELANQETEARINLQNKQAAHAVVETMKGRQEIADNALGKKTSEQFGNALQELNDVDGDFSKLKPSSRVIIGESASKLMPSITSEIRELQAANDPSQQPKIDQLFDQLDRLRGLAASALLSTKGTTPPPTGGVPAGATIATNPQTGQKVFSIDGGKTWNPVPIDPRLASTGPSKPIFDPNRIAPIEKGAKAVGKAIDVLSNFPIM